jgi:hypothetical protein
MLKSWLYYIIDKNGNSYRVNNDVVETTSTPTPLENTPDGWQDISIGYDRDLKKLGIVRSFTLPLSFIRNVSRILRTVLFTTNIEEQLFLLIQKLSVTVEGGFYRLLYQYFYKGELDLSTFKYEDVKDTVLIVEGGIHKQIAAGEGTIYEIPVDDPEAVTVKHDGMYLNESAKWIIADGVVGRPATAPLTFLNKEGDSVFIACTSQDGGSAGGATSFIINTGEDPVDVNVTGGLSFTVGGGNENVTEVHIYLRKYNNGAFVSDVQTDDFNSTNNGDELVVSYNLTETLDQDDELVVAVILVGSDGNPDTYPALTFHDSEISASYRTRFITTYIKCLKPSTVLKRLIAKITGSENNCDTTFIEQYDHLLLTCGDALRRIEGASIKTSLVNFSDFVRTQMAAGQGIEGNIFQYNEYEHFFDTSDPIDLGNAKELKVYPATDLMANTVRVGYPVQQVEGVNGKYSFSNSHLYSSPITRVVKEATFMCPYISDPFYIEIIRINFEGRVTTDNKADNEVFILNTNLAEENTYVTDFGNFLAGGAIVFYGGAADIENFLPGATIHLTGPTTVNAGQYTVNATVVQGSDILVLTEETTTPELGQEITVNAASATLKRETYDSITGIPEEDTIYNVEELTPKRILLKHKKWINSIFYGFTGKKVKFESTEKNKDLVTVKDGVEVKEKGDYSIATDILFKPYYMDFDLEVPANLVELLEANINRSFRFWWYDVAYIGFLVKAGIAANDFKPQSYKLLCAPDNDLTNLI